MGEGEGRRRPGLLGELCMSDRYGHRIKDALMALVDILVISDFWSRFTLARSDEVLLLVYCKTYLRGVVLASFSCTSGKVV